MDITNLLTQLATGQSVILTNGQIKIEPVPDGYHLHTPYDAGFVADLKTQLPYHARRFDKAAKVWWISKPYLTAAVLDIIADWFIAGLGVELARVRVECEPAIELIAEGVK